MSVEDEKAPDDYQHIQPAAVQPAAVAHPRTEQETWDAFRAHRDTSQLMKRLYDGNKHRNYVRYNSRLNQVEPIERHAVSFRKKRRLGDRMRARHTEIHELHHNPMVKRQDETDIHKVSRLVDPLYGVLGTEKRLGRYIQLKVLPNVLNICIKKGVQQKALFLLSRRLLEQNVNNFTHILIKRLRNGRFFFKSLFSSKQLKTHTADTLALELMKLIKNRKYIHLVAKPNMNMYKSFEEEQLLR